jgi:phage baseplate assembly protein W
MNESNLSMNRTFSRPFLGRGLAFPLRVNAQGEVALASGESDIEQAIHIILGTAPGERVMRPEFGCRAHELIFAPRDATTEGLMVYYVQQALGRWEPRIDLDKVTVVPSAEPDGALIVEVDYRIKSTHDIRSIVFPFFIADEE